MPGWDAEDPTVPAGWSTRMDPNGQGKLRKKFQDPQGRVVHTRRLAYQRLLEEGRGGDAPPAHVQRYESCAPARSWRSSARSCRRRPDP